MDWAESWTSVRRAKETRETLVTWDAGKLFILKRLPRPATGEMISGVSLVIFYCLSVQVMMTGDERQRRGRPQQQALARGLPGRATCGAELQPAQCRARRGAETPRGPSLARCWPRAPRVREPERILPAARGPQRPREPWRGGTGLGSSPRSCSGLSPLGTGLRSCEKREVSLRTASGTCSQDWE